MKRILITGSTSFIGKSLKNWLERFPNEYSITMISLKNGGWKINDFSRYDVLIHVAGIAHKRETKINKELYYKINRDLAYEVAKKAKNEGVKQFVFLSSMSVYGIENGKIDSHSTPHPKSNYGKSKLQAENLLNTLNDSIFNVAILRPPMVYGKECRGNYVKLSRLAVITPIFPDISNNRSMIYIDNLSEFIKYLIDTNKGGTYLPQNSEYVNTSEMVSLIGKAHRKNIKLTKILNPIIRILRIGPINKVFGDLVYSKEMSQISYNYSVVNFEESINQTEK